MVSFVTFGFGLVVALATSATAQTLFTLSTFLPGSPINGLKVHASSNAFFLGLPEPSTYCPSAVADSCPINVDTVFAGLLGLSVQVPGGQQIYVASNGVIGYTLAHSISTPAGAYQGGFVNVTVTSDCESATTNVISWASPDGAYGGILACPGAPYYVRGKASHQIYARTPSFNRTDCIALKGLQPTLRLPEEGYGAWQYT